MVAVVGLAALLGSLVSSAALVLVAVIVVAVAALGSLGLVVALSLALVGGVLLGLEGVHRGSGGASLRGKKNISF